MAATDFITARQPLGTQEWSVKNTSGSAIPSGSTVKLDTGNPLSATQPAVGVILTAANNDEPFGVTVETIPAGGYGRCAVVDGTGVWAIADSGGAIAVGAQVMPSAAVSGSVATYTTTHALLGEALTATVNTGDPVFIKLSIRGVV